VEAFRIALSNRIFQWFLAGMRAANYVRLVSQVQQDVAALFRRRVRKLFLAKYRSLDQLYLEADFS
jgi:hypothetical protein